MQVNRPSRDRSKTVATTTLLLVVLTGVLIISSAVGGRHRERVMAFAASSPSSSSSSPSRFQTKRFNKVNNNKDEQNKEKIITMLQSPHPIYSPIEKLEQTIEDCKKLGITDWDIYGDFDKQAGSASFLRSFEKEISQEFGKEDGVFMPSGGMAQSIALLIHSNTHTHTNSNTNTNTNNDDDDDDNEKNSKRKSKKKLSFICHRTSHLLLHEQDGYRELCGLDAIPLPHNGIGLGLGASPLLYQHVQDYFEEQRQNNDNGNDVRESMISTIMLELPHRELGGKITPWEDIIQLRKFATTHDIKLHCDGARIFEATTATGYNQHNKPLLVELVDPFDSVYISFYKGLGGMSGAMLLGSKEFCDEARVWLRRFGGNLYTLLPYAVSGWAGYKRYWKDITIINNDDDENNNDDSEQQPTMTFQDKKDKLVHIVKELSSSSNNQKSILLFEPSIPEVNMVHCYLQPSKETCELIRDEIINEYNGISIFHRLRPIEEEEEDGVDYVAFQKGYRCKFELSIGEANGNIPTKIWIQAWSAFFNKVTLLSSSES